MHLTILPLLLTITSWCNFIAAKPAGGFVKQTNHEEIGKFIEPKLRPAGRALGYRGSYGELPAFYKCVTNQAAYENEVRMQTRIAQAPDTNYGGKQYIIRMYDNFEYNQKYCIVYEDGGPRAIKDAVKFNDVELMNKLFTQVVTGVAFLHSIGLGHGDLKQDNILVSGNTPANYIAKIIDFDLAQEISTAVPNFDALEDLKPPEFSTSRNGFNMKLHDAWGLGVLFFKLLTNQGNSYNIFTNPNAKKYKLIREKLLRTHSLLGVSSSSLLTPKSSNSIIKKVLMLVDDADKRLTPEAMVQHILEENLRKK